MSQKDRKVREEKSDREERDIGEPAPSLQALSLQARVVDVGKENRARI